MAERFELTYVTLPYVKRVMRPVRGNVFWSSNDLSEDAKARALAAAKQYLGRAL